MRKLFSKIKSSKAVKKIAVALSVMSVAVVGAVCASAEVTTVAPATIVSGVQAVTDAVTTQFNITTIASIIGVVLAGCVGLFLFWWGSRKVVRMITSAFKKGKISL